MHAMMLSLLVAADAPPDLSWLAGYWLSCDGGREVSETWSDARAGEMLGNSITFGNGKVFWEQARIGRSGDGWAFFARPMGQEAETPFALVRAEGREATFENKAHDYPQRVIYRRDGDTLTGRIEGTSRGKPRSAQWRYSAAPLNSRC